MKPFRKSMKVPKLFFFLLIILTGLTGCASGPSLPWDDGLSLKSFSEIQRAGYSGVDDLLITTMLDDSRIDGKKFTYYGLEDQFEDASSAKDLFLVSEEKETVGALKISQDGRVYFYIPTGLGVSIGYTETANGQKPDIEKERLEEYAVFLQSFENEGNLFRIDGTCASIDGDIHDLEEQECNNIVEEFEERNNSTNLKDSLTNEFRFAVNT